MKTVIITVPMMQPNNLGALKYSMDDKAMEYEKPVRCAINGILSKTVEKDKQVKAILELSHWWIRC